MLRPHRFFVDPTTCLAPFLVAVLVAVGWPLEARGQDEPADGLVDDAMAVLGIDPSHTQRLIDGEALHTGLPEFEVADNQVAAGGVMLLIRRPLADVVEVCFDGETFRRHSKVLEYRLISEGLQSGPDAERAFADLRLTAGESAEPERLLRAAPGKKYNLSVDEIARFRSIDHKDPKAGERVSEIYREILIERHRSYLESGLGATKPYSRADGRRQSPGQQLTSAAESALILRKHFPDFHAALLGFPQVQHEGVNHRFYWVKQMVDERPAFILTHSMIEVHEDHALGGAMQYYVGHGYDSMLTLVGAAPWQDGTLLFCVIRAFSEKVSGFPQGIRHKKGRKAVGQSMAQHYRHLREALEAKDRE